MLIFRHLGGGLDKAKTVFILRVYEVNELGKEVSMLHNNLIKYRSPFAREFDSVFDDFFHAPEKRSAVFAPAYDLNETESHYLVSLDLPGLKKEDIKVEINEDKLEVSGERKNEYEGKGYRGRSYGSFYQSFRLPKGVDANDIDAQYRDGVLELAVVKKLPEKKTANIEVKNGKDSLWNRLTAGKKDFKEVS